MRSSIIPVVEAHTPNMTKLFDAILAIKQSVQPDTYLPFFNAVAHISTCTEALSQYVLGLLLTVPQHEIFLGLKKERRKILEAHLSEMVSHNKISHTSHFKEFYKLMGYDNFDGMYSESNNVHCKYMIELKHVETDYKIAEKKISYLLVLLEVIQLIEPKIMQSLRMICLHSLNNAGGPKMLFTKETLPVYLKIHESKQYHSQSLLTQFYNNDIVPNIISEYCPIIVENLDKFFCRTQTLIVSGGGSTF